MASYSCLVQYFSNLILQIWRSALPTLITVTWMRIVWIPWAHIPVFVELDILETDKLAMVRNKQTNKQTNKHNLSCSTFDVDAVCDTILTSFWTTIRKYFCIEGSGKNYNQVLLCNVNAVREKLKSLITLYFNTAFRSGHQWLRTWVIYVIAQRFSIFTPLILFQT